VKFDAIDHLGKFMKDLRDVALRAVLREDDVLLGVIPVRRQHILNTERSACCPTC
jgi:hypothetical protein